MAITTSAQSLIVSVFRMLGITAQAENPNAPELQDGFARLNELVDAWTIERLTHNLVTRAEYATVGGQSVYTIGPASLVPVPDWIGVRPQYVTACALLLTTSSPYTELPLGEFTDSSWQSVMQKTMSNSQPSGWKYDATAPAGTFTFWPVVTSSAYPIVVYAAQGLPQFADLVTRYTLPPGYMRALRYNLAREIAHEFGRELPPRIELLAIEAKAALQHSNVPMMDLTLDAAVTPTSSRAGYNIWTGTGGH